MLIELPESVAMTMVKAPNTHLFSRQSSSTMDSDNTVNDDDPKTTTATKMPLLPPELPVTPAIKEELQHVVPQVAPHHFVFAYGSLICRKSRAITAPSLADKEAIPVQVQDVERIWAKRTKRGMTAMGVRFRPGAVCTGVLLPVTEAELQRFDQREEGYDRYLIPLDNVQEVPFLADENHYEKMDYEHADVVFDSNSSTNNDNDGEATDDDDKAETDTTISTATTTNTTTTTTDEEAPPSQPEVFVWIYVQRYDCPADEDFPIAQSYVDIILRGCMGISHEFARSFIETTKGWSPEEVYGEGNADDPVYDSDNENDEEKQDDGPSPTCMATSNNNNNDTKDTSDDGDQAAATWVDDRDEPIYMRADPVYSEKKADVIDQLLEDHIPEHLDNREPIESEEDDGGLA